MTRVCVRGTAEWLTTWSTQNVAAVYHAQLWVK